MNMFTEGVIVAIIGLLAGAYKLIDYLVKKSMPKKSMFTEEEKSMLKAIHDKVSSDSSLNAVERKWLEDLHIMHNLKNEDGTPIWYFPPSIKNTVLDIKGMLEAKTKEEERGFYLMLDNITRVQEKCLDKLDDIGDELKKLDRISDLSNELRRLKSNGE